MGLSELPPGSETSLLLNPLKLVRRQVTKLFVQLFATGKLEPGVSARLDCDSLGQTSEVSAHETRGGRTSGGRTVATRSCEPRRVPVIALSFFIHV